MRRLVLVAVAALLVTGAGVAAGTLLWDDDTQREPGAPPFSTTPLASFDTSLLTVPRAAFCAGIDERQVSAALGGEATDASAYDNGDEVALTDGVTDVAHEYGCVWTGPDGSEARAWVFAPPMDSDRAQRLVREASKAQGCESSPTPAYGAPSVGLACTGDSGARASYRGLFGDAWLTCELRLTDPQVGPDELRERAGAWCVGVALGASGATV
jgi:hypothetical protein